eukprot:SAG31_NODE_128_length_23532_cov_21.204754_12_plen_70_part_00
MLEMWPRLDKRGGTQKPMLRPRWLLVRVTVFAIMLEGQEMGMTKCEECVQVSYLCAFCMLVVHIFHKSC